MKSLMQLWKSGEAATLDLEFPESVRHRTAPPARVLDYGSYFGNVSLMCTSAGYQVDAVDSYRAYAGALAGCVSLLEREGIRVSDFAEAGFDLGDATGIYDAVFCLG